MSEAVVSAAREEGFFDFHLYSFPGEITLDGNAVKQVSLVESSKVSVARHYRFVNQAARYQEVSDPDQSPQHASVLLEFENRRKNNIGIPLPGGRVRVLMEDAEGIQQFVGEDRIGHIPVNSPVELQVGKAFDVTASRRQMSWTRLGDRSAEVSYTMVVKNARRNRIEVTLDEKFQGDWVITQQSEKGVRVDGSTQRYRLSLAGGEENTLSYSARIKF